MKHFLFLLSIFLCFNVEAQTRKTFYLDQDFGLNFMQSKVKVQNMYPDTNAAKAKYPYFWKVRAAKGYRWGSFMALSAFDAAFGEACWQGQGNEGPTKPLNSHNHVVIPTGEYWQTITAEVRGNEVRGEGTGHVGTDGKNSCNTELVIWHEAWQDSPTERHSIQTSPWNLGRGNSHYSEGGRIENLSFSGRQEEFLSQRFNSSAIRLWYPGECYTIDRLFPSHFRTAGIEVFGATPLNAGNVSCFGNVVAGVLFYSSGATINWNMLSGDDNGALWKCVHGYDDTGGGLIHFGANKMETAVASDGGRVWRDQIVGYLEGQFGVVVDVVSSYAGARYQNTAFITDSRSPVHPPQGSCLSVGAFRAHNFKNVVMQLGGGATGLDPCYYACKGDLSARGFDWSTDDDGKGTLVWKATRVNGGVAAKIPHSCTARVVSPGTSYPTGCSPYRDIAYGPPASPTITYLDQINGTTPPPEPTGTWNCTSWSTWTNCSGGEQMRTRVCTCTGTCTEPKPVETEKQACGTTPPPTSGVIATKGSNTNANAFEAVDWKSVRKIRFYAVRFLDAANYQRLAYAVNDTKGIRITSAGWIDGTGKPISASAPYAVNTPFATYELTFTNPTDLVNWLGKSSSGAALRFECSKVEILP